MFIPQNAGVRPELLTTGQAAELLGLSRQGVVDLCEQGRLPFSWAGSHRRLRRRDVAAFRTGDLTRDQERSLWLHRVVAGRLSMDPDAVLTTARTNIATMRQAHRNTSAMAWIDRWASLLDGPLDVLLETLTALSTAARELRQNSPFAGVVPEEDRQAALHAFRDHWKREHAA